MILTYISDKPSIFKKNYDYFAFEIYIDTRDGSIWYRAVNPYGEIAIYDGKEFEIKRNFLENMVFIVGKSINHIIQLNSIKELDEACGDVNGIWGAYHDGNKEVEEKIHDIVRQQAEKEGYHLEKVIAV